MLFLLPQELRKILSDLHIYAENSVKVYRGLPEYIGLRLRAEILLHLDKVVAVGDMVCNTIASYVGVPRLCIVDGKTLRESSSDIESLAKLFRNRHTCRNPAGTISSSCIELLKSVLDDMDRHIVVVDGEEDLLALAVVLFGRWVDYVVYGVPRVGVAVIDVPLFRVSAINIFSQFKLSAEHSSLGAVYG